MKTASGDSQVCFSKTHIQFLTTHPEWFSKSIQGESVLYNDTAAACVNGPYQQECSLQILEEVISNYPVDGVFFNMFGLPDEGLQRPVRRHLPV